MTEKTEVTTDLLVMVGRIDANVATILTTTSDHSRRLADLEAWKNRLYGIVLAAGLLGGVAGNLAHALTASFGVTAAVH